MLAYQYLQTLPQMAKGEANKVWLVPSDFGSALQGFTKMLGAPGEDGVFRYTPSPVDENLPKPEDDSAEVAEWFTTQTDPAIAQAVAKAEADARTPVPGMQCHPGTATGGSAAADAVPAAVTAAAGRSAAVAGSAQRCSRVAGAAGWWRRVRADLVDQARDTETRGEQRHQDQQRADVVGERVAEDDDRGGARQQPASVAHVYGSTRTADAPAA